MSTTLIAVPKEYGYVVVTVAGTWLLGLWHGVRVGTFRKPAGIAYPKPYADSAEMSAASAEQKQRMYLFNCAKRAESNYHENHASVAMAMLIAGLRQPVITAGMGVAWMACRVVYMFGYTRADKTKGEGRLVGSGQWLFQLGLYGMAAWSGITMVM